MNRILILLACLLVVGVAQATNQFPRTAHLISNTGDELVATINDVDGNLVFGFKSSDCEAGKWGNSVCSPVCEHNGILTTSGKPIRELEALEFALTCGGIVEGDDWALRSIVGTINWLDVRGEGSAGGGLFVFLNPLRYSEYLQARENQKELRFSTAQWAGGLGETNITHRFTTPEEKFCHETYHEEYGEAKWLEMVREINNRGAGIRTISDPKYADFYHITVRCTTFLSADKLTWIGNDTPQYLVTVDRTIEEYEECYSAVHDPDPSAFGAPRIRTWMAAVDLIDGGTNEPLDLQALKSLCKPFLSADYRTWTAPLPDELRGQREGSTVSSMGNPEPKQAVESQSIPNTDSGEESAPAPTTVAKPDEVEEPVTTLKQKLLLLRSLVEEGLITEEDYNQAKKQILDNM